MVVTRSAVISTPGGTGGRNAAATLEKPYAILVSFDGFRHDYLSRYDTPHFDRVATQGAMADALIPVFPTETFPAHYSLATGLHPERHGLVGNRFFDPVRGEQYSSRDIATVQDGTWYGGEPIWVTAETQGMVAASMLFVATEAAIGGVRPTFWIPYADRGSSNDRVDGVLDWLALPPERRPHVVMLYFSLVDRAGHDTGPATPEVADAVRELDGVLGRLLDGLDRLPHGGDISLVLVSDHGMAGVDPGRVVNLHDIADLNEVRTIVTGTGANLFVAGGEAQARAVRDDINDGLEGGRAYLRDEVPAELHYRADPRIGDVVVVAEPGALIGTTGISPALGMHGWRPDHPDMPGIFLARGPEIRPGLRVGPLNSVDVYPLLAHLLHLAPNPDIDGDLSGMAEILVAP